MRIALSKSRPAGSAAGGGGGCGCAPRRCCSRSPASRAGASADIGTKIIERCTHGQSLSGFSQQDYRRALKELPTEVEEYSDCANLIRRAQLAAAGGGGGRGRRRRPPSPRR